MRSDYFREKFLQDGTVKKIEIKNISFASFTSILEYIYTGEIENIDINNCLEILIWAKEFNLKDLKALCENNLIYNMESKNVIDILIASHKYKHSELKNLSMNFLLNNFSEVSSKKAFENLEQYPQLLMEVMKQSLAKLEIDK